MNHGIALKFVLIVCVFGVCSVLASPLASGGQSLDYRLPPNFGLMPLMLGFRPDPVEIFAIPGGEIDAWTQGLGNECLGYVTEGPTYRVHWSGRSNLLRFVFDSQEDTTLVVNDPTGRWYCNDDSYDTYSPTVDISNPTQGQYDIWVGNYSGGSNQIGLLYITTFDDIQPERSGRLDTPDRENIRWNNGWVSGAPSWADFSAYTYGEDGVEQKTQKYCRQGESQIGRYAPTDEWGDSTWLLSDFSPNESITLAFYQGDNWNNMSQYGWTNVQADDDGRAWVDPNISTQTAVVAYGDASGCVVSWPPYVNGSFNF